MPKCVCSGSKLKCSFGTTFGVMNVTSQNKVNDLGMIASIMDYQLMNLGSFGMCQSLANPTVASATASAMGTLTPMPCVANILGPWAPGNGRVIVGNYPILTDNSKLFCAYGGIIQIQAVPPIPKVDC